MKAPQHPTPSEQREAARAHKAINWVVSFILVVFAIWSINLNAEGRSLFKQTTFIVNEMDKKIDGITQSLHDVKDACQPRATIVVPAAPTDTQNVQ